MHHNIFIVGAGGIGIQFAPALASLLDVNDKIIICDGDTIEGNNLNRQYVYKRQHLGKNKAVVLSSILSVFKCLVVHHADWFNKVEIANAMYATIIACCVDNNEARMLCLEASDTYRIPCIIGANETTDAEALIYYPDWKDTDRDPRVYYPIYLNNVGRVTAESCQTMRDSNPQLSSANQMASAFMLWLYNAHFVWGIEKELDTLPYGFVASRGNVFRKTKVTI